MKGDLIYREDVLNALKGVIARTGLHGVAIEIILANLDPVEAEPVVHAHWVKNWCDNNLIGHEYEECSACGCSMLDTNQFWDSKRCPNCGAHMDEEVT